MPIESQIATKFCFSEKALINFDITHKMTELNSSKEMEIFQIKNGMFQYFLPFDPPQKIGVRTSSITLKLRINKKPNNFHKNQKKLNGIDENSNSYWQKQLSANVWQFSNKQKRPLSTIDEHICKKSAKRVTFNDKPIIRRMYAWQFAYKQARKGEWQNSYSNKLQFESRIDKLNTIISPILEAKIERMKPQNQWHLTDIESIYRDLINDRMRKTCTNTIYSTQL